MRFKNSSNNDRLIYCDQSSCISHSRVGSSYSRDSWNLTFNVSDVTVYDTSTYYAEADLIDPNDQNSISTITSTININVTLTKGILHMSCSETYEWNTVLPNGVWSLVLFSY